MKDESNIGYWLSELRDLHESGRLFVGRPLTDSQTMNLTDAAVYVVSMIGSQLQESEPELFDGGGKVPPEIFVMTTNPQVFSTPRPRSTTLKKLRGLFAYYNQSLERVSDVMPA